jgi:hypothetical protein
MANGIPALLGKVANITNTVSLVVADAQLILGLFAGPKWGIGINGVFQVFPDSVVDVEFKRDWQISNAPQEQGAFQSYNKVATPYDAHIRMTKGGTEAARAQFLDTINALAASTVLVDVVTPTKIYRNANITHYDYRRTSTNGVGLLTVDIALQEIRIAPSPAFTNTAAPSGADSQQGGSVQTQAPTGGMSTLFGPNTVNFQ